MGIIQDEAGIDIQDEAGIDIQDEAGDSTTSSSTNSTTSSSSSISTTSSTEPGATTHSTTTSSSSTISTTSTNPPTDAPPQYEGSRIANALWGWQEDEDVDVTDWTVGDDFMFSVGFGAQLGKQSLSRNIRLRWRNVTDIGSFTDLNSTGELTYDGDTNLGNGNGVTAPNTGLSASQTTYVTGIQREGENDWEYTALSEDEWSVVMYSINTANALGEKEYEFELYNVTDGATIGTCLATLTTTAKEGYAFGEQNPTDENSESWATWSDGAAGSPEVVGDVDWGQLKVQLNASGQSAVKVIGSAKNRMIVLTRDKYGSGSGNIKMYIRGEAGTFDQDAALPAWEEYIAPVKKSWRFIQTKVEYSD